MKNILFALAIICLSFLTSCKKGDEPIPSNPNKINDTTYKFDMYYLDRGTNLNVDNSLKTIYISVADYNKLPNIGETINIYIYKNNVIEYRAFVIQSNDGYTYSTSSPINSEVIKFEYNHDKKVYNIQYFLLDNTATRKGVYR